MQIYLDANIVIYLIGFLEDIAVHDNPLVRMIGVATVRRIGLVSLAVLYLILIGCVAAAVLVATELPLEGLPRRLTFAGTVAALAVAGASLLTRMWGKWRAKCA